MYCFICKLCENEVYCDELYNHKEENVTSDESSASLYEYEPGDNEQFMGNGDEIVKENNTKDNRNEMDTDMNLNTIRNDCQPPLVELVAEFMVDKEIMALKCSKNHTWDGMVTSINDTNDSNELQPHIENDTRNETVNDMRMKPVSSTNLSLDMIQQVTKKKKGW